MAINNINSATSNLAYMQAQKIQQMHDFQQWQQKQNLQYAARQTGNNAMMKLQEQMQQRGSALNPPVITDASSYSNLQKIQQAYSTGQVGSVYGVDISEMTTVPNTAGVQWATTAPDMVNKFNVYDFINPDGSIIPNEEAVQEKEIDKIFKDLKAFASGRKSRMSKRLKTCLNNLQTA